MAAGDEHLPHDELRSRRCHRPGVRLLLRRHVPGRRPSNGQSRHHLRVGDHPLLHLRARRRNERGRLHDVNRGDNVQGVHGQARVAQRHRLDAPRAAVERVCCQPHADGARLVGARDPALGDRDPRQRILRGRARTVDDRRFGSLQPDDHHGHLHRGHPDGRGALDQDARCLHHHLGLLTVGVPLALHHGARVDA